MLVIRKPYAVFLGDAQDHILAKTGYGLRDWASSDCVAQVRESTSVVDLGLTDTDVAGAKELGARSLVIGIAPDGGRLPAAWRQTLLQALEQGMDVVSGLHEKLSEDPRFAKVALANNCRILDIRHPTSSFPVGTGARRTGNRLLTVGTDCAVGKKYSALAIYEEMKKRTWNCTFRATGQTGILISGSGIAVDAVVADFVSGAAESLSPSAEHGHWDVIEGQGSLFHPSYASVSLGLLHGSQPDAIVMCHTIGRKSIDGLPGYAAPSLGQAIKSALDAASLTNPDVECVGVCINTSAHAADKALDYLRETSEELSLPCVDPVRSGVELIVNEIESRFAGAKCAATT